jgi:hypothetical protein
MTNGICRLLWIVKLETYQGALVAERKKMTERNLENLTGRFNFMMLSHDMFR